LFFNWLTRWRMTQSIPLEMDHFFRPLSSHLWKKSQKKSKDSKKQSILISQLTYSSNLKVSFIDLKPIITLTLFTIPGYYSSLVSESRFILVRSFNRIFWLRTQTELRVTKLSLFKTLASLSSTVCLSWGFIVTSLIAKMHLLIADPQSIIAGPSQRCYFCTETESTLPTRIFSAPSNR